MIHTHTHTWTGGLARRSRVLVNFSMHAGHTPHTPTPRGVSLHKRAHSLVPMLGREVSFDTLLLGLF